MSQYPGGQPPQDPYYGQPGGDPYAPPPPQPGATPSDPYFGQSGDPYAPPPDQAYAQQQAEAYAQQQAYYAQQQAWQAQQTAANETRGGGRGGAGTAVFGILLVLVGAWILFGDEIDLDLGEVWPLLVVGLGVVMVVAAFIPRRGD